MSAVSTVQRIQPEGSPPTVHAYSHGMLVPLPGADILFTSGQIAKDSKGNIVGINDAKAQTEVVFENLKTILSEAGMGLENVIKTQIFLTNAEDIPVVKEARNKYYADIKPVSTMVVVSKLARADCRVEIEVTAVRLKNNSMSNCNIDPNNPGAKKECKCFIKKFFKRLFGCNPDKSGQGKKDGCCKTDGKAEDGQCCMSKKEEKKDEGHCGCGHNH